MCPRAISRFLCLFRGVFGRRASSRGNFVLRYSITKYGIEFLAARCDRTFGTRSLRRCRIPATKRGIACIIPTYFCVFNHPFKQEDERYHEDLKWLLGLLSAGCFAGFGALAGADEPKPYLWVPLLVFGFVFALAAMIHICKAKRKRREEKRRREAARNAGRPCP